MSGTDQALNGEPSSDAAQQDEREQGHPPREALAGNSGCGTRLRKKARPLFARDLLSSIEAVADCTRELALKQYTWIGRACLSPLFAEVGELVRELVANVFIDRSRHAYPARFSYAFQTGGKASTPSP